VVKPDCVIAIRKIGLWRVGLRGEWSWGMGIVDMGLRIGWPVEKLLVCHLLSDVILIARISVPDFGLYANN
jgi:hypothetical protein